MIQFPHIAAGRDPIWVNPVNVTFVEQIGPTARAKIHFAGGDGVEVGATAPTVAVQLNGQLK